MATATRAQADEASISFLDYVKYEAAMLRAGDGAPATLDEWKIRREALTARLLQAWCGFPAVPCPLEAKKLGEFERGDYRVEKIVFQTRPGVWMTANAYVPDRAGKLPAVLAVHGHWPGAKQDPVVQSRCIGLAKLGFVVLAVDAFGAGERGVGKALGEYHGDMTAATLLPVGLPLCGLQVYENMRAVDYLLTRPEVDGARLGITGASGGGNQTMYASAWDGRFAAGVPVCSVGNFQAYLGEACCMCEVVPGMLRFAEEWAVLSLNAPRALMVINATKDSVQFSVDEANKSVALAQRVFDLCGKPDNLEHAVFDSPHAYSRPIRESMYGWMTKYLKGEGEGARILEPEIKIEDPEALRCFPGDSRPGEFVTIPAFAAAEAEKILDRIPVPADATQWRAQRAGMCERLAICLQGIDGAPPSPGFFISNLADARGRTLSFLPEPRITLTARQEPADSNPVKLAVLLDFEGGEKAASSELARQLYGAGWALVTLDLRATGKLAWPGDGLPRDGPGRAPDHSTAEWSLWLGRPLLGQWVVDVRRLLDTLETANGALPRHLALIGIGPAGTLATCAGAIDKRITHVAAVGSLASYVTDAPYENQRLGLMAPGILREAGDIPHLAALLSPRALVVAGGVAGGGELLEYSDLLITKHNAEQAFDQPVAE